jgi:hypothetical protein
LVFHGKLTVNEAFWSILGYKGVIKAKNPDHRAVWTCFSALLTRLAKMYGHFDFSRVKFAGQTFNCDV